MNATVQNQAKTKASTTSSCQSNHAALLQRMCACGGSPGVAGECEQCSNKKLSLQRSAEADKSQTGDAQHRTRNSEGVPAIVHDVVRSPGQRLDEETRTFMEPRFGWDFGNVRVHSDARAAESARAVNSLAYTVGRDLVFAAGQYAPHTIAGKRVLAHELAHVVQQGGATSVMQPYKISSPDDSFETEASLAEEAIISNKPLPALSAVANTVQRQDAGAGDAGAPAPDAGTGDAGAPPAAGPAAGAPAGGPGGPGAPPAAPAFSLTAVRVAFNTAGAPNADNCAVLQPAALGVGVGGTARHNMEMIYRIDGTIPPRTEFDILRTRRSRAWQSDAAGTWSVLEGDPAGTNDDHTNDDECLTPRSRRLFVVDTPGFGSLDPRGVTLVRGSVVSAAATGFVRKFSMAEWVIARNRDLGVDWTAISSPTFTFWHSIHSVASVGGVWSLANTPSGDANEIALGSVNVETATP